MASYSPKLLEKKYNNWVKAQLAVLITKEGIEPFVCNELQRFQLKYLDDICYNNGLCSGTLCSSCCTENVIRCPTNKICNVGRGTCSFHRNAAKKYLPTGCPNKICHNFKAEIQNVHRYHGPSFKNTDATQWCGNPWEIAKCFMPPDGYKDVVSPAETDFNGIISVINNYKDFQSRVHENLNNKINIFEQARKIGREVRHSPVLEVEDKDLQQYFRVFQTLLSDPGYLATDSHAQKAKQKLIDLENDTLVIGKDDIRKALDDVAKSAQDKIRTEISKHEKQYHMIRLEMIKRKQRDFHTLKTKTDGGVKKIKNTSVKEIGTLKKEGRAERQKIGNLGKRKREQLEEVTKTEIKRIKEKSYEDKEEKYIAARKNLRDDLFKFYGWRYSKVQLSPLFKEKDTPLDTFYIRPEINEKVPEKKDGMQQIDSLSNMFKSASEGNREIYLTADAGLGKTTFSKYLVTLWHQANCQEENDKISFEKGDIECMSKFKFVFLVFLRDSSDLCSIDELIYELIISNLAHRKQFDTDILEEILNREKCLVILDGLDEWTHPENPGKPCYRTPQLIPHRIYRDTCTVLTTTRPWKLGVLNLSSNELGKEVTLTKLSKDSAFTLTKRSLRKLKSLLDEESAQNEAKTLLDRISAIQNTDLVSVPLLLMYIICLWCDEVPVGNSKCELYINIVELLLSRTTTNYKELKPTRKTLGSIPDCFSGHAHCTEYFSVLVNLGKLAYYKLFNAKKEETLVFERLVAETFLKDDMKLSLHSGILTENTTRANTKQFKKVSFSHKTVQEFFAAIFISSQNDGQKKVLEKCETVQSILDISPVCQFISGINVTMMCEILEGFMSVINEDRKTREYRTKADHENIQENPLYHIQDMLVSCLKEMQESENIQVCLQDLFISRSNEKDLQRLSNLNKKNIKSLHMDIRRTSSSLREIIDLSALIDLNYLQKLHYEGDGEEEAEINCLLSPCLQSLCLRWGKWTNCEDNLSERLEQMQNLQYLCIYTFTFSHKILDTFLNFFSSKETLKKVKLSVLDCNEHGGDCARMKLDLSKHSQLTTIGLLTLPQLELDITTPSLVDVTLWRINLGESSLLLSPEMLNIKRVELKYIEMSAESLQNNVKVLENLPQSVTVDMYGCRIKPETKRKDFRKFILSSQIFEVTRDSYNEEDEEYKWWSFEFNTKKT